MPSRSLVYAEALLLFALYTASFGALYRIVAGQAPGPWTAMLSGQLAVLLAAAALVFLINRASVFRRGLVAPPTEGGSRVGRAATSLFLLGAIALAVRLFDPEFDDVEFARHGLGNPAAFLLFLASLPLRVATEEIVFRACQDRLRRAVGARASLAAIAAAFALYHLAPLQALDRHALVTLAAITAGGLVLGGLYERTQSLTILVVVHLGYDLLAVTQGWLHVQRQASAEIALWVAWLLASASLVVAFKGSGGRSPEDVRVSWGWRLAGGVVFGLALPLVLREIRALF